MEEVVLAVAVAVAATATVMAARASRRHGAPGAATQLGVGLLCGAACAIAAAVPYADVVPDRWEPGLLVAMLTGSAAVGLAAFVRRVGP